jgi:hypothetical protein
MKQTITQVEVRGTVKPELIPGYQMEWGCRQLKRMITAALEDPERRAEYAAFKKARAAEETEKTA